MMDSKPGSVLAIDEMRAVVAMDAALRGRYPSRHYGFVDLRMTENRRLAMAAAAMRERMTTRKSALELGAVAVAMIELCFSAAMVIKMNWP